jgi:hypothetical protein
VRAGDPAVTLDLGFDHGDTGKPGITASPGWRRSETSQATLPLTA